MLLPLPNLPNTFVGTKLLSFPVYLHMTQIILNALGIMHENKHNCYLSILHLPYPFATSLPQGCLLQQTPVSDPPSLSYFPTSQHCWCLHLLHLVSRTSELPRLCCHHHRDLPGLVKALRGHSCQCHSIKTKYICLLSLCPPCSNASFL